VMADYLVNTVERLAKSYDGTTDEKKSYKNGVAETLRRRLYDMNKTESVADPQSTALVKRETAAVENYMNQKENMKQSKPENINIKDMEAYLSGLADGNNINLHGQIGTKTAAVSAGLLA
jgi:hypothetical protein